MKMKRLLKSIVPTFVLNAFRAVKRCLLVMKCRAKVMLSLPLKQRLNKIRFEVNVAEHCNLNCKGCSNFSCIAEPEFVDIEEFKRDFERMGELFGHECERIYIIGGEPLLNPEINALIKIARQNFSHGDIYIFTNGILLSKKGDDFWKACHDNKISIWISAYPIKIDTETIHDLASKFDVNVNWAWKQEAHEHNTFSTVAINLAGNSDIPMNFAICNRANNCITLKHGRLFTCTFAPHVHHFNKYFDQNVAITDADSVDIYSDLTGDDILRRMSEPIPACRYCETAKPPRTFSWCKTSRNMNEWL